MSEIPELPGTNCHLKDNIPVTEPIVFCLITPHLKPCSLTTCDSGRICLNLALFLTKSQHILRRNHPPLCSTKIFNGTEIFNTEIWFVSFKKTQSCQQLPVFERADWNANWYCRERSKFPHTRGQTFPTSPCPLAHFLKNSASQSRSCKFNPFCHQMMDTLMTRARDSCTVIPAQIERKCKSKSEFRQTYKCPDVRLSSLLFTEILIFTWSITLYCTKRKGKKKPCRINANHELTCQPEVLTSNAITQCLLWQKTVSFYPSEKTHPKQHVETQWTSSKYNTFQIG